MSPLWQRPNNVPARAKSDLSLVITEVTVRAFRTVLISEITDLTLHYITDILTWWKTLVLGLNSELLCNVQPELYTWPATGKAAAVSFMPIGGCLFGGMMPDFCSDPVACCFIVEVDTVVCKMSSMQVQHRNVTGKKKSPFLTFIRDADKY